jgi:hypothetical protein
MFSCLGRLVSLALLLLVAAAGWLTRDTWLPKLRARFVATPPPVAASQWEPLTPEGAARGRTAFDRLTEKNGPVYVNLAAGDFAAAVLDSLVHGFSAAATDAEALARDDHLYLRAQVSVADLGGPNVLGPLTGAVSARQQLTVRGRIEMLKSGRAQFRVDEIALGELKLPAAVIPRLASRIGVKDRDAAIAADGIPFHVPRTLADVRVGKGRVTLYKNVP